MNLVYVNASYPEMHFLDTDGTLLKSTLGAYSQGLFSANGIEKVSTAPGTYVKHTIEDNKHLEQPSNTSSSLCSNTWRNQILSLLLVCYCILYTLKMYLL